MKAKIPQRVVSPDDYQTPKEAVIPILSHIPKDWVVWEPTTGSGFMVDVFKKAGYNVIATDFKGFTKDGISVECDFLSQRVKGNWDIIVTNPPFSLKYEFLRRCYELKAPFALLLPLTTLETPKRQALFKQYGLQLILLDKRINFLTLGGESVGESGAWFPVGWFCLGLNLKNQIVFESINGVDLNGE